MLRSFPGWLLAVWLPVLVGSRAHAAPDSACHASSEMPDGPAAGAMDGDRFTAESRHAWHSGRAAGECTWEVRFAAPRRVGSILQVVGDHDFVFRNAPTDYHWEGTADGQRWFTLAASPASGESRLYRIHRLRRAVEVTAVRLRVHATTGDHVVLREVEFYPGTGSRITFPEWIVAVNVTHEPSLPGHGQEFIPLARRCADGLQAQQVWLDRFDPDFVRAEPRPLCAFLSGSFKDWCEVDRGLWRGIQGVLRGGRLPLWASCGGAQGLGLVSEYGVDHPWDCPHCRDPRHPKSPLYGHIGHTGTRPCGDYSACVFERGPHEVLRLGADPAFAGLPQRFRVMESHCGQLEWAPRGWRLIATAGEGTLTRIQCIRRTDAPIYAAQFHIEMAGTPEVSERIMRNFLEIARARR